MSAGGPVIFQDSTVFEIISVNSLNINRRPIIVSNSSSINKNVECTQFFPSAKIIRLKKDSTAISALAKKAHLAEELLSMPPSSKLLLKTLEYEGALTQKDLANKTLLPDKRSMRFQK
jgi:NAD+ kinase